MRENVSRKDAKARKGAKRCRVFGGFLCAFAGLGAFAFERSVLAQALLNAASQGKSRMTAGPINSILCRRCVLSLR